eukprot:GFUD01014598.1.p1 GENE.GFUD01014598.1~~GFUD01014598.1.p1  ORF type:complete len:302 (+),score=42.53 GFUD01014598.1:48-953(+)
MGSALKLVLFFGLLFLLENSDATHKGEYNDGGKDGEGEWLWYLTWWGIWGLVAVGLIALSCVCACACGANPCYTGMGVCCCALPCLWVLFCIIMGIFDKGRCDLCGKKVRVVSDWCDCFCGNHKKECLEKNQTEYEAIPASPLYKCKRCQKLLKLWPIEKLSETRCFKCEEKYPNDGTNVHVCFDCVQWTNSTFHLCSKHHRGEEIIEVNFEDRSSVLHETDFPLLDVENPTDPSAPTAPSIWTGVTDTVSARAALLRQQSHPNTIMELASEDMSYAGRRLQRLVSSDLPPPPTYEEAVNM